MTPQVTRVGSILFFLCINDRGGAELSMLKVAQGLAAQGREVVCAVYGTHAMLARDMGFEGEIIDLGVRHTWASLIPLYRLLRGRRFSTVISALTHTNLAALMVGFLAGQEQIIVTEHGLDGLDRCDVSPLLSCLTRRLYAQAACVITVSQGLAQRWREILPRRVTVRTIYNPLVPEVLPPRPLPAHPWLTDKTVPVIIGMGRLTEEKNFSFLLRSFAHVCAKRPLRLVILGEGDQRKVLEQLTQELNIGKKVLMPGFIPAPEAWLAHTALLVCPSAKEGFGNVIVEALAWGVPVIAADCPYGPAEILENGTYGRLVAVNDVEELAAAIFETLELRVDQQKLRARAQDFAVTPCIDAYAALIDTQTSSRTSPMTLVSSDQFDSRWRSFFRWLRSVFFYEHWMVGVIDQPIRNALTWTSAPPVRWVEAFNKKRYLADPFPWPGSADTILCEDYDNTTRLGRIAVLKLDANGIAVEIKTDFPIPGHVSFPFLFLHQGEVYAMLESSAVEQLHICRWQEREGVWLPYTTVFADKAVADAVLFFKDGFFWISYTDVTDETHDNLHLIYAQDLKGPWATHAANPVRRGRESSRNGGAIFEVDGKLYRPAQDCTEVYGGALRIMEIITWSTTTYRERQVTRITPSSPDYPDGFHTLVAWGDQCLVDGMRLTFSWRLVWEKIKRRAGSSLLHILINTRRNIKTALVHHDTDDLGAS